MTRTPARPSAGAARLLALCAVVTLGLTACGSSPVRAGAAAVVGDSRISTDQLAQDVEAGLADPGAAQLAADRPAYQRDVLSRLITGDVVQVAAQREGVSVSEGDVDEQYRALESSVGGPEQLRQQAGAAGLTLEKVRELARSRALSAALGDKLTEDVPVSQAQLQQAYQAGIDTFDQVRVAQVQLPDLAAAQALLPQARGLDDDAFRELARARSTDEATKGNGGDLGYAGRTTFEQNDLAALGTAAFAAQPGATFAVATPRGGHVVRVLDRRTTTLEQATPQLRRTVLQEQRDAAVQQTLTRTAESLDIKVNPRFGAWDGTTLAVVERTDTGERRLSTPAGSAPAEAPAGDELLPEQQ